MLQKSIPCTNIKLVFTTYCSTFKTGFRALQSLAGVAMNKSFYEH